MDNEITAEEIAQHYSGMGQCVDLINAIINGDENIMENSTDDERRERVDRNVRHLENMVAKDFWGDEDMSAVNAAITAGQAYTAT